MSRALTATSQRVEIPLSRPHPAQQAILASRARFVVVCCGRRFGKTDLLEQWLVRGMLNGEPCAYFIPIYKLASQFWRRVSLKLAPITRYKNEGERHLDLVTGGSLDVWTMDAENAGLGRKYGRVAVDEAAAFGGLDEMWQRNIRPTLTDLRGKARFTSTPRGRNFYWDLYQKAVGGDPSWASFVFPTTANPFIDPAEVEEARRSLPDRIFRQEYLAEFLDDGAGVFRRVRDLSFLDPLPPRRGGVYVAGIDWGRSHDYTVVSVIDAATREQVVMDRFTGMPFEVQRGRIRTLFERYPPTAIFAEENSFGSANIEALIRDGLPVTAFTTTQQTKTLIIDALALAFERGDVALLNDEVQIGELQAYEYERTASGHYRYNAPEGKHDDTVIALALAWHAATRAARPLVLFDM